MIHHALHIQSVASSGTITWRLRTALVLEAWAAADPGTPDEGLPDEGLTVKQEIKAIHEAMTRRDEEFLARYGGFAEAGRRSVELQRRPEAKVTEGCRTGGKGGDESAPPQKSGGVFDPR